MELLTHVDGNYLSAVIVNYRKHYTYYIYSNHLNAICNNIRNRKKLNIYIFN